MMTAQSDNDDRPEQSGAYLVVQSAGRWSDVFRLSPPVEAVVGRTSSNQIVIRNDQASRRHARIFWNQTQWQIEDLGSRNGTFVNGNKISQPNPLSDKDLIDIAGYTIQFTKSIEGATANADRSGQSSNQATDDQLTMEMDPNAITDRRRHSSYLTTPNATTKTATPTQTATPSRATSAKAPPTGKTAAGKTAGDQELSEAKSASAAGRPNRSAFRSSTSSTSDATARNLLQLAFSLARCEKVGEAIETVLDVVSANVSLNTIGAYLVAATHSRSRANAAAGTISSVDDLTLMAARQSGQRSYRRPPDALVATVAGDDGQAILARNVLGDRELATENSRGEIDVQSVMLSPIRDRNGKFRGLLHLTTAAGDAPMVSEDLEFVVAASEILAESLAALATRKSLSHSLQRSRRQIRQLQEQLGDKVQIIGNSESVTTVIEQVALVSPTNATVLIRGESGVGKELVAAAIHYSSNRRDGPLVCMNCAALSESLLESELFGHEKGAFTGATDRKQGKFELADGGTLMLDEIGEMSEEIQAKFLRVLEGHPFERVGGQTPIKVDVRVIAATNRDLQSMVAEGTFRQDLYYRLHVVEIVVPPLRQRGKDILHLADHFLKGFNAEMGRKIDGFTQAAAKRLLAYSWPGNVRELKNVVERAVVLNTKNEIDESDLSLSPAVRAGQNTSQPPGQRTGDRATEHRGVAVTDVQMKLADVERQHIEAVLRHTEGNKSRAANILGIERSTLDRRLKRFAKAD